MISSRNDFGSPPPRIALYVVLATACAFVACGGDDDGQPPNPSSDAGEEPPTPMADAVTVEEQDAIEPIDVAKEPTIDVAEDLGPPDRDGGSICRSLATMRGSMPPPGVCPLDGGNMPFRRYACLPAPESGTCDDAYDEDCVLDIHLCGLSQRGQGIACGPLVDATGQCCYVTWGNCLID